MNFWIGITLFFTAVFFSIFNLIRNIKENKSVHFFKMKELNSALKTMQLENRKLVRKTQIGLSFETTYQNKMKELGKEIVELQHMFLAIITSTKH